MIASMHFADLGASKAIRLKAPRPAEIPGLRSARTGVTALFTTSPLPALQPGRAGMIAFWDDDAALDRFLNGHAAADALAGGWRVRLEPIRAHGSWPGLATEVPKSRNTEYSGPSAVMTLGRAKWTRIPAFLRTSSKAEAAAADASGKRWATALAKPPFFATCSLWESTDALMQYAYGGRGSAHDDAIGVDRAKPFHHESAFIRFRPYDFQGALSGKNPVQNTN